MQEPYRIANRRGICIGRIILNAKSLRMDMDTVHKHASDEDTPGKRTTCGNFPLYLQVHM